MKKRIALISASIVVALAVIGGGVSMVNAKRGQHIHARKCRIAAKKLNHSRTARALYNTFRSCHLTKKQSSALVGLAYKESNMHVNAHQAGGIGYGLYQVTSRKAMARWCRAHHLNYKTARGQGKYLVHAFVRPAKFQKSHGSLAHEARLASMKVGRSAVPSVNRVTKLATKVYKAFA